MACVCFSKFVENSMGETSGFKTAEFCLVFNCRKKTHTLNLPSLPLFFFYPVLLVKFTPDNKENT